MSSTTAKDRRSSSARLDTKSDAKNCTPVLNTDCKSPNQETKPVLINEILPDVTAYIEVRSGADDHFDGVAEQMKKLGAKVTKKFTADVTHVIYKEGTKSTREKALKKGIPIVNVLWIESCKEHGQKAKEDLYPIHMTPRRKIHKFMQPKSAEETAKESEERMKRRHRQMKETEKCTLEEVTKTCIPSTLCVIPTAKQVGLASDVSGTTILDEVQQSKTDSDDDDMPETYIQRMAKKLQFDQPRYIVTPTYDSHDSSDDEGISIENDNKTSSEAEQQGSSTEAKQKPRPCRGSIEDFFPAKAGKRKASNGEGKKENKRRKKTQYLVMTSMHSSDQDIVVSVVEKLGVFSIQDNVTSQTTHVIAGDGRRTLNVLKAISTGCWLLSLQWAMKSLEASRWIDEEPFELSDIFPSAQLCRLERSTLGNTYHSRLLADVPPIYIGTGTSPPSHEIRNLITLSGGQVSNSFRKATICIGQVPKKIEANHLSEKWLLDSITSQSVLPYDNYEKESSPRTHRSPSPTF